MTASHAHAISHRTVALDKLWLEAPLFTNPRTITGLGNKDVEEMGESIKIKGLTSPLKVQKIFAHGGIVDLVIDGQRRVLGAREVLSKNAPIPVVDRTEEPLELTEELAFELLMDAMSSLEREGLSSFELSNVADDLVTKGKTLADVSKVINMSTTWISKILKARKSASPKLLMQWRKGEITDEQFKDLAEIKDPEKQGEKAKDVIEARKSGDKSEARVRAKEHKETERAAAKPAKKPSLSPANGGHQAEMFDKKVSPKLPSKVAIEELLALSLKRPPTADYVKGIFDGVRWREGLMDPSEWNRAWAQYLSRVEGKPKAKKAKVKRVKARKAAKPGKKKRK